MSEPEPIDYLSVDDLLEVAAGVLDEVRFRDAGLLASAAARPSTTIFGADAYPTFAEKAAALMHSPARNHTLVDGNKRLAWSVTRAFCCSTDATSDTWSTQRKLSWSLLTLASGACLRSRPGSTPIWSTLCVTARRPWLPLRAGNARR